MHLAVSAVYGLLFGLIYRLIGRGRLAGRTASALMGLVYGLALLLAGARADLHRRRRAAAGDLGRGFAIAHLIYGLVLGWLVARS